MSLQKEEGEQTLSSHLIIRSKFFYFAIVLFYNVSCRFGQTSNDTKNILHGTIAYPFGSAKAIGISHNKDKLVLKSLSGQNEYVLELPDDNEDFNLEIPLSEFSNKSKDGLSRKNNIKDPSRIDREIIANFPNIAKTNRTETAVLDNAFGVSE